MSFDLPSAIRYGLQVLRVENIPPEHLESAVGSEIDGYGVIATIYGNDRKSGAPVSFGQILHNVDETLVAIPGTRNPQEWIDDARFFLSKCDFIEGDVEQGFLSIYKSLRIGPEVSAPRLSSFLLGLFTIKIGGHSLGASLATLLAADLGSKGLRPTLYTYASPHVGDVHFAETYKALGIETHRIANRGDLVIELPACVLPFFPYAHVGEWHELIDVKERSVACRHHLQNYLHILTNGQVPIYPGCE